MCIILILSGTFLFTQNSISQETGKLTDKRDGKKYNTVKIGSQVWMAENLAYFIQDYKSDAYNNKDSNLVKYGYLYTWEAAQSACPAGWHLPTLDEWYTLVGFLGGRDSAANKMKIGKLWQDPTISARKDCSLNESGFSAFPGGSQRYEFNGSFELISSGLSSYAYWWTNSKLYAEGPSKLVMKVYLSFGDNFFFVNHSKPDYQLSVRCVKNTGN